MSDMEQHIAYRSRHTRRRRDGLGADRGGIGDGHVRDVLGGQRVAGRGIYSHAILIITPPAPGLWAGWLRHLPIRSRNSDRLAHLPRLINRISFLTPRPFRIRGSPKRSACMSLPLPRTPSAQRASIPRALYSTSIQNCHFARTLGAAVPRRGRSSRK